MESGSRTKERKGNINSEDTLALITNAKLASTSEAITTKTTNMLTKLKGKKLVRAINLVAGLAILLYVFLYSIIQLYFFLFSVSRSILLFDFIL